MSIIIDATKDSYFAHAREQGLEEGIELGIIKGEAKGRVEGRVEAKEEILTKQAAKLLKAGIMTRDEILDFLEVTDRWLQAIETTLVPTGKNPKK